MPCRLVLPVFFRVAGLGRAPRCGRKWCASLLLLLAAVLPRPGRAQQPAPPAKPPASSLAPALPARKPGVLPPKQLEEALRLLLRADSAGRISRRTGTESQGLVMDQTVSKLGRDFYDLFYGAFEAPPGVDNFTIALVERQARANNAVVALLVNDTELFELPLPPRAEMMEETAQAAVAAAFNYLVQAQNISRQLEAGQHLPPEVY